MGERIPLNLTLDSSLVEEAKIRAVREKRSLSQIVEELLREYLKRKPKVSSGKHAD